MARNIVKILHRYYNEFFLRKEKKEKKSFSNLSWMGGGRKSEKNPPPIYQPGLKLPGVFKKSGWEFTNVIVPSGRGQAAEQWIIFYSSIFFLTILRQVKKVPDFLGALEWFYTEKANWILDQLFSLLASLLSILKPQ